MADEVTTVDTVTSDGDLAVADGYARTGYRDLVVRQFLGQTDDQAHHYSGAASPDLIVAGTEPVDDPQATFGTSESYAVDPSVALTGGATNYLYPRTRMPEGVDLDGFGRLFLGLAPPTAMLWPDQLQMLGTAGGQPHVDVDVPAGTVGVAGDAFVTEAGTDPASTLGGYVYTIDHPVNLPTLGSLPELAAWLYDTPGFAQRCVGSIGPDTTIDQALTYEHRGDEPVRVMFHLRWQDCPDGWEVGLEGDHGITIPTTAASGSAGIGIYRTFDGPFTAGLTWHLSGGPLDATTTFNCSVYFVRDEDGALIPLGRRALWPADPPGRRPRPRRRPRRGARDASDEQPQGARMATEAWDDLFVRTSLSETSPNNRTGGWSSPDIIPTGTTLHNPAEFTTAASYNRYYNEALYENRENYIYVRAKNSSPSESASAKVWTVVRDPAVVLWPSEGWPKLMTSAGLDYSVIEDVGPGEIGVTGLGSSNASAPFTLIPDFYGHRCLVSWLSTTRHPAPENLPNLNNAQELTAWLVAHPNYAHQNIDVVADTTGTRTLVKPFQSGERDALWVFQLTVQGCKGFTVGFACATPLADGRFIEYVPTLVTQNDRHTVTIDRTVEAGFSANISYFYDQNNNALPDDFYIGFQAGMSLESTHPLYEYGRPYEVWDNETRCASPTTNRAFELGSVGAMKESAQ